MPSRGARCQSSRQAPQIPSQTYFFLGALAVVHAPVTVNSCRFIFPSSAAGSRLKLILESDPASLKPPLCKIKQQVAGVQPFPPLPWASPFASAGCFTDTATSFSILCPQGFLLALPPPVTIITAKAKVEGMSRATRAACCPPLLPPSPALRGVPA